MFADVKVSRGNVASCHVVTLRNAVNSPAIFSVKNKQKKKCPLKFSGKEKGYALRT